MSDRRSAYMHLSFDEDPPAVIYSVKVESALPPTLGEDALRLKTKGGL